MIISYPTACNHEQFNIMSAPLHHREARPESLAATADGVLLTYDELCGAAGILGSWLVNRRVQRRASDASVRAEAFEGLALRDQDLALPLIEHKLQRPECEYGTFQAASRIAHPSLLNGLRGWSGRGGASWIDDEISHAIAACETAMAEFT